MQNFRTSGRNVLDTAVTFGKISCGLDGVTLRDRQGVTVEISASGMHIWSFKDRDGNEILYTSTKSSKKSGTRFRGGIPVMGPWVGPSTEAPDFLHGTFRRTVADISIAPGSSTEAPAIILTAYPNEVARQLGYGDIILQKKVAILNGGLSVIDEIHNQGSEDILVDFGSHTYLAVSDISNVQILGMIGYEVKDRETNRVVSPEFGGTYTFNKDNPAPLINLLFTPPESAQGESSQVVLIDAAKPECGILISSTHPNRVLWNQGDKVIDDVDNPRGYVCFEPVDLQKGRTLLNPKQIVRRYTNYDLIKLTQKTPQHILSLLGRQLQT